MKSSMLKEKGWTDQEIKHAEETLAHAEKYDLHFSKIVFWSAIVVIVFANLIVSVVLIPVLIALKTAFVYLILAVLAATVGFLYNFLITDIGHLERRHHVTAGIIVPLLALINMVVMVLMSNRFINDVNINEVHNPWLMGVVFAVVFIIPALADKLRKSK